MRNSDELIDLLSGADTDKNGTINYTGITYSNLLIIYRIHSCNNRGTGVSER